MIYQKILLPISGKHHGERAQKALDHALKFVGGEIILLHVYPALPDLVGGEAHQELVREAEAEALNLLNPIRAIVEKAGFPCRVRVAEGEPENVIVHVAHEEQCDIIVMFTDGRDQLTDLLLGSISERVLRATDIPLLAIRR